MMKMRYRKKINDEDEIVEAGFGVTHLEITQFCKIFKY